MSRDIWHRKAGAGDAAAKVRTFQLSRMPAAPQLLEKFLVRQDDPIADPAAARLHADTHIALQPFFFGQDADVEKIVFGRGDRFALFGLAPGWKLMEELISL